MCSLTYMYWNVVFSAFFNASRSVISFWHWLILSFSCVLIGWWVNFFCPLAHTSLTRPCGCAWTQMCIVIPAYCTLIFLISHTVSSVGFSVNDGRLCSAALHLHSPTITGNTEVFSDILKMCVAFPFIQTHLFSYTQAALQGFKHDSTLAAPWDIQLRVSDVS